MKGWVRVILRIVRPLIEQELKRIADEKDQRRDADHRDVDSGFQLLHELKPGGGR